MSERSEFCRSPEGADAEFDGTLTLTCRGAVEGKLSPSEVDNDAAISILPTGRPAGRLSNTQIRRSSRP